MTPASTVTLPIRWVMGGLSLAFRVLTGVLFFLLQKVNPRDPRSRLAKLDSRDRSVVRARVVWAKRTVLFDPSDLDNFLLWSQPELCSLDILLAGNVSLYCLSPDYAVFVRTPPDLNLYGSEKSPFFYLLQFLNAQEVYVTSHPWLHALATEISENCRVWTKNAEDRRETAESGEDSQEENDDTCGVPVTWLSSTGRCGSTMLSQMMENVPGTASISEPDALENIVMLISQGLISPQQTLDLVRSSLRVLVHHAHTQVPCQGTRPTHVFMKGRSECTALVRQMHEVSPHIRHVFMYRRLPRIILSYRHMADSNAHLWLRLVDSDLLASVSPRFRLNLYQFLYLGPKGLFDHLVPNMTMFGIVAIKTASHVKHVRQLQEEGLPIPALLYEDVLADPQSTIGSLFDFLHIPRQHLSSALTAMDVHSQRSLPQIVVGSQKARKATTEREQRELDTALELLKLPKEETAMFTHRIGQQ